MNRKPVNVELLEQYAKVSRQLREIETEKEMIGAMVLEHLREVGQEKVTTGFGFFNVMSRKSYKFSPKVAELKEKAKRQEAKEIDDGTAEESVTTFLKFDRPRA